MTGQQLINRIRLYTRTDSSTFPDADILALLNEEYGMIMAKIIQTVGDYNVSGKCLTTTFKSTDGLSPSDTGYDGTYSFPVDLLRPVRIEVSYDGTNYKRATEYDLNDNQGSEKDWSDVFSKNKPYVRFFDNYYMIRPTPDEDIASGIKIWYEHRSIGAKGDGTTYDIDLNTSPALEETFHPLLVWTICVNYGMIYPDKMNPDWSKKAYGIEQDMLRFYSNKFYRQKNLNPIIDDFS